MVDQPEDAQPQKQRGPKRKPPTKDVVVRLRQPLMELLDEFCARHPKPISRAEAVRLIIEEVLNPGPSG